MLLELFVLRAQHAGGLVDLVRLGEGHAEHRDPGGISLRRVGHRRHDTRTGRRVARVTDSPPMCLARNRELFDLGPAMTGIL